MKITAHSFNLPFRYPFTISRGTKTHQPTLIVELEHFGIKGYGEAPSIKYYNITVEQMIDAISRDRIHSHDYERKSPATMPFEIDNGVKGCQQKETPAPTE